MTSLSPTETVMRPASAALAAWFPASDAPLGRHALLDEQAAVSAAISATVARMGLELDVDTLDDLTEETAALLARAEEIRMALALAARAADETWLLSLDLD
jgi:hypothetical protein